MSSLARQSVSAAKWGFMLTAARIALQVVSQAILARILGPEVYGIFGLALVLLMLFGTFLTEFGMGIFLLQRPHLSDDDMRFALTWQVLLGALGSVALFAAAPLAATLLNEPRLEPVVRWISISCLLMAAAYTATHLLYRDLDFRTVGLVDVASYTVGYLFVGLPLALWGYGVTALVVAWLVQWAVRLALMVAARPHPWRPKLRHPEAASVLRLGRSMWATLVVNWILVNLDRLTLGRHLGSTSVGLYNAAFNLASTATSSMSTLGTTFLSSGARVRDDPQRLQRAYLQVFAFVWVIVAPAFALLAMLADAIVLILYGARFTGAGPVLFALLLGAPALLSFGLSTPLLWNTGRGYQEPVLQLPILVAFVVALMATVGHGIVAVAWLVAGTQALRATVAALAACRAIGLRPVELLPQLARGAAFALLAIAGAWVGGQAGHAAGSAIAALALAATVPALLLVALVWARPTLLGAPAAAMVLRIAPPFSRWIGPAAA
jgi:lipopolysaccharide exporter